jgi:hypothetical protein
MKKTLFLAILGASAMSASAITIDGTITAGEWAGAAQYTIGNGGGTASFRADANYIYGAFDITGWTEPNLASTTHGFLLGFGVLGSKSKLSQSSRGRVPTGKHCQCLGQRRQFWHNERASIGFPDRRPISSCSLNSR